jgi:hypothetical protein
LAKKPISVELSRVYMLIREGAGSAQTANCARDCRRAERTRCGDCARGCRRAERARCGDCAAANGMR